MRKRQISTVLFFLGTMVWLALARPNAPIQAQVSDERWTEPKRLSPLQVLEQLEGHIVSDPFGDVHVFWRQVGPQDDLHTIQHTRFDGEVWSEPIDIYLAAPGDSINFLDVDVDGNGLLHLAWTEGNSGPLYYMNVPAHRAASARAWSEQIPLNLPAYRFRLEVDDSGLMHLLYSSFYGVEPGVFYTQSQDGGVTWSDPAWLDPDLPSGYGPDVLQLEMDDAGGLHAAWNYLATTESLEPGWAVRYARLLEGNRSWETPIKLDEPGDEPAELRLTHPLLSVRGDQVMVIWSGTQLTNREYRLSPDRGATWGPTKRIFGELHGQAVGDGLAWDGAGRLHFVGQIRWPQGLWHAVWDGDVWASPEMFYLISRGGDDARDGRYHAHHVRAAVRAGHQLVVIFTDEVNGPLYATSRYLNQVAPLPTRPVVTATPPATQQPTPTVVAATPTPLPFQSAGGAGPPAELPNMGSPIWLGMIAAVVLIAGVVFFWYLWRQYRSAV